MKKCEDRAKSIHFLEPILAVKGQEVKYYQDQQPHTHIHVHSLFRPVNFISTSLDWEEWQRGRTCKSKHPGAETSKWEIPFPIVSVLMFNKCFLIACPTADPHSFIHLAIHLFSSASTSQGCGAGVYPSCHRARGSIHAGQASSLSKGLHTARARQLLIGTGRAQKAPASQWIWT